MQVMFRYHLCRANLVHGTRPKNGTKYDPDKKNGILTHHLKGCFLSYQKHNWLYSFRHFIKVMAVERCIFRKQKGFKCTEVHSSVNIALCYASILNFYSTGTRLLAIWSHYLSPMARKVSTCSSCLSFYSISHSSFTTCPAYTFTINLELKTVPASPPTHRVTSNTGLLFCPHCGNKALMKVAMVMSGEEGTVQYRVLSQKQCSHKGLKVCGCGSNQATTAYQVLNARFFRLQIASVRLNCNRKTRQEWACMLMQFPMLLQIHNSSKRKQVVCSVIHTSHLKPDVR